MNKPTIAVLAAISLALNGAITYGIFRATFPHMRPYVCSPAANMMHDLSVPVTGPLMAVGRKAACLYPYQSS